MCLRLLHLGVAKCVEDTPENPSSPQTLATMIYSLLDQDNAEGHKVKWVRRLMEFEETRSGKGAV